MFPGLFKTKCPITQSSVFRVIYLHVIKNTSLTATIQQKQSVTRRSYIEEPTINSNWLRSKVWQKRLRSLSEIIASEAVMKI